MNEPDVDPVCPLCGLRANSSCVCDRDVEPVEADHPDFARAMRDGDFDEAERRAVLLESLERERFR